MRDESEDREHDETAEDRSRAVADGHEDSVAVTVSIEPVVGGEGDHATAGGTKGEYY